MTDIWTADAISTLITSVLRHPDPATAQAMRARIATVLHTLGHPYPEVGEEKIVDAVLESLDKALVEPDSSRVWLLLAILSARLPEQAAVEDATRTAKLDGPLALAAQVLTAAVASQNGEPWQRVEVVSSTVVVDLHHTARTVFATGIQRVARESARRWCRDHELVPIGWTTGYRSLRRLSHNEIARATGAAEAPVAQVTGASPPSIETASEVLVPWLCSYLVPELLAEPERARAFQALVRHSGCTVGMLGFDCVPLTTAETTADVMGSGFPLMLSAATYARRIAAISHGAAREYQGWAGMLAGRDLPGPQVRAVSLPIQAAPAPEPSVQQELTDQVRWQFMLPATPMVLVVGSHEPRKNHLAILHAAELLWRDGLNFSLVFVGGNAWNSERFSARMAELQEQQRPVHSLTAISDEVLWTAYRAARCTVFPSLNEGFGLPVAESLACGTPVITSGFGSMLEIAGAGGALLIDPRSDAELTSALRQLLTDDDLHTRLSAQALALPVRTWDTYAEQSWQYLVYGNEPDGV
jgi:glycosyltransferase involved in cell wall biosynthesis